MFTATETPLLADKRAVVPDIVFGLKESGARRIRIFTFSSVERNYSEA